MNHFTLAFFIVAFVLQVSSYHLSPNSLARLSSTRLQKMSLMDSNIVPSGESTEGAVAPELNETPEEKYKREKLAEIAEKKAAEVFVTRSTGRYECQACGYVYSEADGYTKRGIAPGTPFDNVENFRCPQCGVGKNYFVAETETLSGFKENLKYGFGGNGLTAGQKSNLIFGGLFIGFAIFMSGYLLE